MAQHFRSLIQEDLGVGTDLTWVTFPGRGKRRSTQIGIHTFARGQLAYDADWSPGSVAAAGKVTTTVTVPGAVIGDKVLVSYDQMLKNDLRLTGNVTSDDTVEVVLHNPTAAAISVPSGTARALVFPSPGGVGGLTVYFTWNQIAEDTTVTFTAQPGSVTNASYEWDFGDGNSDSGSPVNNAYPITNATYHVVLTVTGDQGTFQDSYDMTTNYAAGQSGSSI